MTYFSIVDRAFLRVINYGNLLNCFTIDPFAPDPRFRNPDKSGASSSLSHRRVISNLVQWSKGKGSRLQLKGNDMPKTQPAAEKSSESLYFIVIAFLIFAFPLLVLPRIVDNVFNTPKTFLMQIGVSVLAVIYSIQFLRGKEVPVSRASTPKLMLLVVLLNFFSFFYTRNYYYTVAGATMNVTALLFLYFVSLYADGKKAFRLLVVVAASGWLVALETWLEFYDTSLVYDWTKRGSMVVGTIGNSNYLGTYLLFPLMAITGLIWLVQGRARYGLIALWVFVFAALLFSRARAAWVGVFFALPLLLFLVARIHRFSIRDHLRTRGKQAILCGVAFAAISGLLWGLAPQRFHTLMGFRKVANPDSFKMRTEKYFQVSWWLFKESPLFGTGIWSFRNMVYEAQAELEKLGGNFFKDYPEPKPRRVHNEYLEVLNDGGLVAALVLAALLWVIMKHGWTVIRKESVPQDERIIAGIAFSSLVGVLVTALFFFPFRINSTLFMTALMLGITEGFYVRHSSLIGKSALKDSPRVIFIPVILLLLVGWIYYTGYKPLQGELEHLHYKKALSQKHAEEAEKSILKAISYDPHNSVYSVYAAELYMGPRRDLAKAREFLERAINDFNGDLTKWSLFYLKGLLAYQTGALFEARAAFETALYYNPVFVEARQQLEEVNQVLKENDKVLIKLR